jgi:3D (Asp-Asp-Asp) domain-containing protein
MNLNTCFVSRKAEKSQSTPVKSSRLGVLARVVLPMIGIALLSGCATSGRKYRIPRDQQPEIVNMETTGYCKCGKCCGWKRNWKFEPIVAYGPNKGAPKEVGITAAGTVADWGTIAADTRYYPFGTIMHIPDYGWGRVEDIGGAIKGMHIDLYFPTHKKALNWGREWKQVKIWKPQR